MPLQRTKTIALVALYFLVSTNLGACPWRRDTPLEDRRFVVQSGVGRGFPTNVSGDARAPGFPAWIQAELGLTDVSPEDEVSRWDGRIRRWTSGSRAPQGTSTS
jgi:hypothetical protein